MQFRPTTTGPAGPGGGGGAGIVIVGAIIAGFAFGWGNVLVLAGWALEAVWRGILVLGFSIVLGLWKGLILSGIIAVQFLSHFSIGHPHLYAAILGVASGLVIGWLRMVWRAKEKYDPLISSVFSSEPFQKGGWEFLVLLVANIIVGYLVAGVFSGLLPHGGFLTFTTHDIATVLMQIGGGGFGGGGYVSDFILVLIALIVAAMLIGATSGGALGSVIGSALWKIDVSHAVFGSAQGATVHLLTGRKHGSGKFWPYVIGGAMFGGMEGIFVGGSVGAIVAVLLP
jgi:hypothetical protein